MLPNMADMGCPVCERQAMPIVVDVQLHIHLVGMNKIMFRKYSGVRTQLAKWHKMWGCHKCCDVIPILFGWFFKVPSLHVRVFVQKTFFVTCSCCLYSSLDW